MKRFNKSNGFGSHRESLMSLVFAGNKYGRQADRSFSCLICHKILEYRLFVVQRHFREHINKKIISRDQFHQFTATLFPAFAAEITRKRGR